MKLFDIDEYDIPTFKTLYKKTSTGAIQSWKVKVVAHKTGNEITKGEIVYTYGQHDTDKPQTTNDFIKVGKNKGKANETSILEQTIFEAKAKFDKQKKKGYVESIDDAKAGKIDNSIIQGGINPMLAHKYRDHPHKINFPCYSQPKFDGHRCLAVVDDDGKCTLWSRTRKKITAMVHIERAIESILKGKTGIIFDGELYNHDYRNNFEELSSAIRQKEVPENFDIIQYHIYDMISDECFSVRHKTIDKIIPDKHKYLKKVETVILKDSSEVKPYFNDCISRGYEGSMVRNMNAEYEFKRSYHLQKVKQFEDAEFKIVGIEEGTGKLRGHVGAFICVTPQGNKFNAKMAGDVSKLKEYFENHKLWTGKKLTVQFQGWTSKENVPRFPVGLRLREDL